MIDPAYYSDLWHHDIGHDWAGHEDDCLTAPTPETVEEWHVIAGRIRDAQQEGK